MTSAHLDPVRRHDAVILFDVTNGNPNGDPDNRNQPRTDDETGHGLVTDVAIKRKIRDTVALLRGDDPRFGIFVESGHALNTRWTSARESTSTAPGSDPLATVCDLYWDVRTFGQVFTAPGARSATVRGPVQVTFARSVDPVLPTDHTITRVTQSRQEDIDKGESTEIGSKWTVPYGLYRANLFYSAPRGRQTGLTGDDLAVLWQAIGVMFDHDRSAARGMMTTCGLYVFSHPDLYGVAQARQLDRLIQVTSRAHGPPRSMDDYDRTIDHDKLPDGVELTTVVDLWSEES